MVNTLPESWSVALSAIYCCADHAVLRILFKASRKSVRMRESKPSPERSSSCSPRSSVMAFSRRGETLTAPADPEFTAPASGITQQIIPTVGSNTDSQKGHTLGNVKSTKDACSAAVNQLKAARAVATGWLQCEQRRASTGISLRHSGHFFVVGSAGAGALRMRETRALMGVTTKKYTATATSRNDTAALMKSPIGNSEP